MKKQLLTLGLTSSMIGIMLSSCGCSSEKTSIPMTSGKITDVDKINDRISLDTGIVRGKPDVVIKGAFSANKVSPFIQKGDYICCYYDSSSKMVDSNTIFTIKK